MCVRVKKSTRRLFFSFWSDCQTNALTSGQCIRIVMLRCILCALVHGHKMLESMICYDVTTVSSMSID